MRRLLLCLVVLVALAGCSESDDELESEPDRRPSEASSSTGVVPKGPPSGTKLVGLEGVAVAVPENWPVRVADCPESGVDSVVLGPVRCHLVGPPISTVTFRHLDALAGDWRSGNIGGLEVAQSSVEACAERDRCARQAIVALSEKVMISLHIRGRNASMSLADIRESIHVVSDGYTTVPPVERGAVNHRVGRELLAAGLRPRVQGAELDFEPGGFSARVPVTGIDPAPGSVVSAGSIVTLRLKPVLKPEETRRE